MHHDQSRSHNSSAVTWRSAGLFAVRYGIGAVMILAGVVALFAVGGETGAHGLAMAVGAGLSVMLLNLLYRMSISGDRDRDREEEARRYFDEHGVWLDDDEPRPRFRGRRWTLPRGAVSVEQEERERRFADRGGVSATLAEHR